MTLPEGWDAKQINAEQPSNSYSMLVDEILAQIGIKDGLWHCRKGMVECEELLKVPVEKDCELSFKCFLQRAKVHIRKGVDTDVHLSFNWITGRLNAR